MQSYKYQKYFIAVHKENNSIISIQKNKVNKNVSIELELFDAEKLNAFNSFFNILYEPPQDLDRICNLKVRKNSLLIQRRDINHLKVFDLNSNALTKRFKIADCKCFDDPRQKEESGEKHKFRIYDSGISFNQKYAILAVGVFQKKNTKKAVGFSLRGLKIPKSAKKSSSYIFCVK